MTGKQGDGPRGVVIAVDGPSGSGKSSVSKAVASTLGLAYLDTGATYRAATWWAAHQGVDLDNDDMVEEAVKRMPLDISLDPDKQRVFVDGHDITEDIRSTTISSIVSKVATNLAVRAELARLQRAYVDAEKLGGFSGGRGVVAEGRDCTTVIAPDAEARVLLTASPEARLARRSLEVHGTADQASIDKTRDQIVRRDRDDATVSEFQQAADGVITIDSSDLDFNQTVDAVLDVVRSALAAASGT